MDPHGAKETTYLSKRGANAAKTLIGKGFGHSLRKEVVCESRRGYLGVPGEFRQADGQSITRSRIVRWASPTGLGL